MHSLEGKVALITGAAGGIGLAVSKRLHDEGARVALLDLAKTPLDRLTKGIDPSGTATASVFCDITQEDDVRRAVEEVVRRFGSIQILISNAGIAPMSAFLETELELFDRVMAVNVRGSFMVARECARVMARASAGCIVQIASTCAFASGASRNLSAYNMSKAAVRQMVASLAGELAPHGIRVNAIAPGTIDTPLTQACITDQSAFAAMVQKIPMRSVGQPSDIAAACAFLCSDDARYITGETLIVDGGWMVR